MTEFRFLHAADIHLDSPLHGLSRYEGLPEDDIRGATRAAFDNLVQRAIEEEVDFVLIAGDLFDGDWKDMGTGLYFAKAMGRLDQAGIPVFILAGNHDAASVLTRSVPWPPNVRQFGSRRPETHLLEKLGVAIHGRSFATPAVTDNIVREYPDAREYSFNIGVLHTALAGRPGHADYAPCSLEDLRSKHYDYWALGHVHEYEVVSIDPYVVFPGNIQGRTIREAGPKGAVIVEVTDGQVVSVERMDLDVIRWTDVDLDCTDAALADAPDLIRDALLAAWEDNVARMPLVVRLTFSGQTEHAGALLDQIARLRDDARVIAASISPDLFIEKVKVVAAPRPASAEVEISDDFALMIGAACSEPALAALVADDLASFLTAAQASLGPSDDTDLRRSAEAGDWSAVLGTAALALGSRLRG